MTLWEGKRMNRQFRGLDLHMGNEYLHHPITVSEAKEIYIWFGLKPYGIVSDEDMIFNAKQLVVLNNQVFENLHPDYFYIDSAKLCIKGNPIHISYDKNAVCFEINGNPLLEDSKELTSLRNGEHNTFKR